jgi:hypothetical protein
MQSIEQLVPGLAAMREIERRHRALAFAGITHTVCGEEIRPLTPRTRLELQVLRNAFTLGPDLDPLEGDIFEFVWVHHPRRPRPGKRKIVALWLQNGLRRRLRARNLEANRRSIREYLLTQLQDMPEQRLSGGFDQSPWVHWAAFDATFWLSIHGGFTLDAYLDTPMLVLQQLYRAWSVNHPETLVGSDGKVSHVDPQFINASDRVRGEWLNSQKESVSQFLRAQRYRQP